MSNIFKNKESYKVSTSLSLPVTVCNVFRLLGAVSTKEVKYFIEDAIQYYLENHPRGKQLMAEANKGDE